MTTPFTIDPASGAIRIGEEIRLDARQKRAQADRALAPWRLGDSDFGNGYAWLSLTGLSFGGQTAGLSLCFAWGRLEQASWGVRLPDADIDTEVAFVRRVLAEDMGFPPMGESLKLGWGAIWSGYDPKAGDASHGLRYGG